MVFIVKYITLIQSNTTQVYFNLNCNFYMSATYFGLYLGHLQACQHKNLTKEGKINIPPIYLKTKEDKFNTVCATHFVRQVISQYMTS